MSPSKVVALPQKTDPRWKLLATNGTTRPLKSLVLKLRLTRINLDLKRDSSPAKLAEGIKDLYDFFSINPQRHEEDIAALFG